MGFIGGIRMFNIAILDDEHDCLDMLSKEINVILFSRKIEYKIKTFFKSDDFLDYAKLNSINLLFLDIDMPGCNGITFSKNIYKTMPNYSIIFMTSHSEYMKEAFNLNVFAFIDKSEIKERLSNTLYSFIDEYIDISHLVLPTPEGDIFLAENEIVFFEKVNRKIYLQTKNKYIQIYYKNLKDIYALIKSPYIIYSNQSCIVNLFWIEKIKNNEIFFKNLDVTQFISRKMKTNFDLILLDYEER